MMRTKERTVADVMTRDVVTARVDTPFKEIARLMHENAVSGVPVLDEDARLAGIVTEADLLYVEEERGAPTVIGRSFLTWFIHPGKLAEIESRSESVRADEIMTRHVLSVGPEVTVREAIKRMLDGGVKRLPVVDEDGAVVGIVSRRDLLAPFLRSDDAIAEEIEQGVVFETMWIDPANVGVEVHDGVVGLKGTVNSRSTKEILVELVRRVDGVVGVDDHLSFDWDDRTARLQEPVGAPRRPENWSRIGG